MRESINVTAIDVQKGAKMEQPCKRDCPRRSADCRRDCPDWAAWEDFKKQEYARRNRERVKRDYVLELHAKILHKKSRRTK